MAQIITIDLSARYRAATGFAPSGIIATIEPVPNNQYISYNPVKTYSSDFAFEDLELNNDAAGMNFKFGAGIIQKSGEMGGIFAPPPMLAWRKSKSLVISQPDGADGDIVERYGDSSWEIRIQGLLVDMVNHQFPFDKMEALRKAFEVPDAWEVSSNLFDALGIYNIYLTEVEFSGVQGFADTCTYNMTARSVKGVEFFLNGEDQ